ncbi:MAG: hypothetical protein ABEJ03_06050 [Candidatus Nanohaloarchaea archaeon]
MENELAIMLAFTLSGLHFLGEEIDEYLEGYREMVVSFGSGVSVSYIFVRLLPEFHRAASSSSRFVFSFPLIGFSSVHLAEKYLAKSSITGERLRKDYAELHTGFLFLYHASIGYLIATLVAESAVSGLLFILPVVIHVAVSSISVSELHEELSRRLSMKLLVSVAPLLGVTIHVLGSIPSRTFTPVFGAVTGMFFYIAVRDSIPHGEDGRPLEYLAGMTLYLAVMVAASSL